MISQYLTGLQVIFMVIHLLKFKLQYINALLTSLLAFISNLKSPNQNHVLQIQNSSSYSIPCSANVRKSHNLRVLYHFFWKKKNHLHSYLTIRNHHQFHPQGRDRKCYFFLYNMVLVIIICHLGLLQ